MILCLGSTCWGDEKRREVYEDKGIVVPENLCGRAARAQWSYGKHKVLKIEVKNPDGSTHILQAYCILDDCKDPNCSNNVVIVDGDIYKKPNGKYTLPNGEGLTEFFKQNLHYFEE